MMGMIPFDVTSESGSSSGSSMMTITAIMSVCASACASSCVCGYLSHQKPITPNLHYNTDAHRRTDVSLEQKVAIFFGAIDHLELELDNLNRISVVAFIMLVLLSTITIRPRPILSRNPICCRVTLITILVFLDLRLCANPTQAANQPDGSSQNR